MTTITSSQILIGGRYLRGATLPRLPGSPIGSAVYRGEDTILKRPIVIKLVLPEYAAAYHAALGATARIGHPAFVGVYDTLTHEGQPALIQEYVSGQTFPELVQASVSVASVAKLGKQLALALAHAHRQGIVHGDLTPAALFRDRWGAMRINNILLPPDTAYFAAAGRILSGAPWSVTAPTYMDDLRAVGAALWLMLAGRVSPPEHLTGTEADWHLAGRMVPAPLAAIIGRLLNPAHPDRFDSAETLARELGACARSLDARASQSIAPPWEVSRPQATSHAPSHDTQATTQVPHQLTPADELLPQPPAAPVSYPLFVGPRTGQVTDDQPTLANNEGAAAPLAVPQPIPQPQPPVADVADLSFQRGSLDYVLWGALALALFLFWLIIGYLLPHLLGK